METKLISGALGAEIKGIDLTDISDENFKKINDLLLEHKVIFFRDQPLTAEQHIALAEKFGPLETHAYVKGLEKYPESIKGPDNLLKLGLSFSNLKKKDEACNILFELEIKYKDAPKNVQERASSEIKKLECPKE